MNLEAQNLKRLGNDAYKKKDFAMALKNYEKAIELEPNEITYYNNIAAVYFQMKNFDKCIKFCRQACKIGIENGAQSKFIFKGFERMGRAFEELGNMERAKLAFEEAKVFLEKAQQEDKSNYEKCLSEIELAIERCQIKNTSFKEFVLTKQNAPKELLEFKKSNMSKIELALERCQIKNTKQSAYKELMEVKNKDMSKFVAKLMKRMPTESDDIFQEWKLDVQQTLKQSSEFVLAHPWPNSTLIVEFVRKNAKTRGVFEDLDIIGLEFYNHDLAKELWESNAILDYVERMIKYRDVGWKIIVHANSLITERSQIDDELMKSLHTFYYLHQHVMCGQGIFPAKGKQHKPIELWGIAGMIESAWDELGPWVK